MGLKKRFKRMMRLIYIKSCRVFGGVKKNRVLFESFNGKTYADNCRAVSEAIQRLSPETEIVWFFKDPDSKKEILPNGIRTVDMNNTWKYYKELATCGAFVTNFVLPEIPKSKKQFFVQLWHGDRAFKKILLDGGTRTSVPEQSLGYCDLAVAGSDYGEMQFRSAFKYRGEILKQGTPRDDRCVHPDAAEITALRKKLKIQDGVMILLYAPTLREKARDTHQKQQIQNIDLSKTLACLREKYGCDWICFVRAHPGVIGISGMDCDEKLIDMSGYEDMADLLLIADLLITDYSSSAGDFALLKRPILLYQSDRKEYNDNSREFYFDMKDAPYYIAETQEKLETLIKELTPQEIEKNCIEILDFYKTTETGNAAEIVAERILAHAKRK